MNCARDMNPEVPSNLDHPGSAGSRSHSRKNSYHTPVLSRETSLAMVPPHTTDALTAPNDINGTKNSSRRWMPSFNSSRSHAGDRSSTEPTYIDRVKRRRRRPHQVAAHTEARTAKNTTFSRGGTLSQGTNPRQSVPLVDASYILGKIRISASDDPCTICHLPMFRKVMSIDNWQPQNPINTHHLGKKTKTKKNLASLAKDAVWASPSG